MSIGVLMVTHRPLASDLLRIASEILGGRPPQLAAFEVINDTPPETLLASCMVLAERLDTGDGLLVLTDLYGATPANVALALKERRQGVRVLAGVNLPMLLRALNYNGLDLEAVAAKALEGGRNGVCACEPTPGQTPTDSGGEIPSP